MNNIYLININPSYNYIYCYIYYKKKYYILGLIKIFCLNKEINKLIIAVKLIHIKNQILLSYHQNFN